MWYNSDMKKILLILVCLCAVAMAGCGVKSDLERPAGPLRNYPVY